MGNYCVVLDGDKNLSDDSFWKISSDTIDIKRVVTGGDGGGGTVGQYPN